MNRLFKIAILLIASAPLVGNAAQVASASSKIERLITYADYGSGDVIVDLVSNPTQCAGGFWISPSSPGFTAIMSTVLAAMHAGAPIILSGHDDQIWAGSSAPFCKIYAVTQYP